MLVPKQQPARPTLRQGCRGNDDIIKQREREREVGWRTPSQLARDLPGGLAEGEGCRPSCRLARGLPDGHAKPLREATVQLMAMEVVGMQVAGHTATWKRMYHFGGYKHIQRAHLKKCTMDGGHARLGPQMNKHT